MNLKPIGKREFDNIIFNVYEVENIKQNSNDWYKLRKDYIGSSEIATILNLSKFSSIKELIIKKVFPEKIDEKKSNRMIMGSILEPVIGDFILPYYENSLEQTIENYKQNKKIRNVVKDDSVYIIKIKNIFYDKEFNIIVSPDYIDTEEKIPYDIKTMTKFSYDAFISDTNPTDYIWQSIMQQIVYDSELGYLFIMIDANDIKLFEIRASEYLPMLDAIYNELDKFYSDIEFAKSIGYEEFMNKYIDIKFDTRHLDDHTEKELIITKNNINEVFSNSKIIHNDVINNMSFDMLIELCQKYIEMNEYKKELSKEEDKIKSIFKQIGNGYKNILLDVDSEYTVKINLERFKINIK
ncbi:MAG: hypothetical protein KatS3mg002_1324 [Candidatus Woesearchaeota archaeon]|nr:MAG: hypothetical protein KatS3mg002_1324 [Candidatus Woesearchaeota archaeon]